jgi:hypothetical protein
MIDHFDHPSPSGGEGDVRNISASSRPDCMSCFSIPSPLEGEGEGEG